MKSETELASHLPEVVKPNFIRAPEALAWVKREIKLASQLIEVVTR